MLRFTVWQIMLIFGATVAMDKMTPYEEGNKLATGAFVNVAIGDDGKIVHRGQVRAMGEAVIDVKGMKQGYANPDQLSNNQDKGETVGRDVAYSIASGGSYITQQYGDIMQSEYLKKASNHDQLNSDYHLPQTGPMQGLYGVSADDYQQPQLQYQESEATLTYPSKATYASVTGSGYDIALPQPSGYDIALPQPSGYVPPQPYNYGQLNNFYSASSTSSLKKSSDEMGGYVVPSAGYRSLATPASRGYHSEGSGYGSFSDGHDVSLGPDVLPAALHGYEKLLDPFSITPKSSGNYLSTRDYQLPSKGSESPRSSYKDGLSSYKSYKSPDNEQVMTKSYQNLKVTKTKYPSERPKKPTHSGPKTTYDKTAAERVSHSGYLSDSAGSGLPDVSFSPLRNAAKSGRDDDQCRGSDTIADQSDPSKYLICEHGVWKTMPCAPGTVFCPEKKLCCRRDPTYKQKEYGEGKGNYPEKRLSTGGYGSLGNMVVAGVDNYGEDSVDNKVDYSSAYNKERSSSYSIDNKETDIDLFYGRRASGHITPSFKFQNNINAFRTIFPPANTDLYSVMYSGGGAGSRLGYAPQKGAKEGLPSHSARPYSLHSPVSYPQPSYKGLGISAPIKVYSPPLPKDRGERLLKVRSQPDNYGFGPAPHKPQQYTAAAFDISKDDLSLLLSKVPSQPSASKHFAAYGSTSQRLQSTPLKPSAYSPHQASAYGQGYGKAETPRGYPLVTPPPKSTKRLSGTIKATKSGKTSKGFQILRVPLARLLGSLKE